MPSTSPRAAEQPGMQLNVDEGSVAVLQEITGSCVSKSFLAHVLRRSQGSVPVRDLLFVLQRSA